MLQELVYRPALVHCLLQALLHEVAVGGGELGLVEAMGVFRGDEIHGLEGGHPEEGRFSLCEFDCYYSDRPDVYQLVVGFLLDELGSHPSWGAHD